MVEDIIRSLSGTTRAMGEDTACNGLFAAANLTRSKIHALQVSDVKNRGIGSQGSCFLLEMIE